MGQKSKFIYKNGTPRIMGVYACRVPLFNNGTILEDVFLLWDTNTHCWCTLNASEYRGEVVAWLGPLPRVHRGDEEIQYLQN